MHPYKYKDSRCSIRPDSPHCICLCKLKNRYLCNNRRKHICSQ